MKKTQELREEVEFWLEYINFWKQNRSDPVPKKALELLDNALLKLRLRYREESDSSENDNDLLH